MKTETINEMIQILTQINSCTLCDNENLRVDIYTINEGENAFKIACSLCQEDLEYFPSEEKVNEQILRVAIESDMLIN